MVSYKIDGKHRLLFKNRLVERVISRYTGGLFDKTPATTVMHFTYGASARSSADWFNNPKNKLKSSAHIVIGRGGEVIQCVDFDRVAHHAGPSFWKGRSGLNNWSFGIELANWGYLQSSTNGWQSWTGVAVNDPVLAVHRNGNPGPNQNAIGWERFTSVQLETAAEIVRLISGTYGRQEVIGHDDISVGRKWDPGPAFDFDYFRALATEDSSSQDSGLLAVFTPGDTLNLREGPGTDYVVKRELKHETVVEPIEYRGRWAMVNVLNEDGNAASTGWINTGHTLRT